MKRVLGLLGLVVLFASSTAAAQEVETAEEPVATERTWYGYQTLAADGIAVVMTGLGVKSLGHEGFGSQASHTTSEFLLVTGGLTYLFAAPTIHALHGHWGKAGASLGLRTAPIALCAAIVGAGSTGATNHGREKASVVGGAVLFLGIVAAMVIDSSVVANESTPIAEPKASLTPTYDPKTETAGLSFAATF